VLVHQPPPHARGGRSQPEDNVGYRLSELLVQISGDDSHINRVLANTEQRFAQVGRRIEAQNARFVRGLQLPASTLSPAGLAGAVGVAAERATAPVNRASQAIRRMDEAMRSLGPAGQVAARGVDTATSTVERGVTAVGGLTRGLFQAAGGLTAVGTAVGVGGAAMTYERLAKGIGVVSQNAFAASRQLAILEGIAELPGIGFKEAIEGSIRLQAVELGAARTQRALREFSNAIAVGAGGPEQLQGVIVQLMQMTTRPKLLMEDLKPIITQAPVVARAIKETFGTISPEEINKQVSGPVEFLDRLLAHMETMERAASTTSNALDNTTDEIYKLAIAAGTPALPALKSTFEAIGAGAAGLAKNIDTVHRVMAIAGGALAGRFTAALGTATAARVRHAAAAFEAARAERQMAATATMAAQAEAAAALQVARAKEREAAATVSSMRATQAAIQVSRQEALAKLTAARAVEAQAARVPISSLAPLGGAAVERELQRRAAATRAVSAATRELATLGVQEARVKASLAGATRALTAAQQGSAAASRGAAAATAAHTAALGRATLGARALAAATAFGSRALAAFGGPVGLAITALTALGTYFATTKSRIEEATDAADSFRLSILALSKADLQSKLLELEFERAERERAIAEIPEKVVTFEAPPIAGGGFGRADFTPYATPKETEKDNPKYTEARKELDSLINNIGVARGAILELQLLEDENNKPGTTDLTAGAASALDRLNEALQRHHSLRRMGLGVDDPDDLSEGLKTSYNRAQALRSEIKSLTDAVAKLKEEGRAAPAGTAALVALRRAELLQVESEMYGRAARMGGIARGWAAKEGALGAFAAGTAAVRGVKDAATGAWTMSMAPTGISAGSPAAHRLAAEQAMRFQPAPQHLDGVALAETFERIDRRGRELAIRWEAVKQAFNRPNDMFTQAAQAFKGVGLDIASQFTPLSLVGTVLEGALEGLQAPLAALTEPLRMMGEILGKALSPILKALFPVFRAIGIAGTWVGEIFFRIAQGTATAIGWLIRAIGKAVDALLPGRQDGITKVGQGLMNLGESFGEGARELARGRKELQNLSWEDALERVGDTAARVNEQMRNVPEGFRVFNAALARYEATAGPSSSSQPHRVAQPPQPVEISEGAIVIHGAGRNSKEIARDVVREIKDRLSIQGDPLGLRHALPTMP